MEEILRAHVVCVVYSVDDESTFDKVASHWLPFIRECTPDQRCPVILVGNKVDLVDFSTVDVSFLFEFQSKFQMPLFQSIICLEKSYLYAFGQISVVHF